MALNWNITAVKDHEVMTTDTEWPVTDALIWATMFVGIPEISEENFKEFYARVHFIEKLNGAFLMKDATPEYITRDDVQRRIGLKTNASSMTRPAFLKAKTQYYFEEVMRKS